MNYYRDKASGFTLVELMVAMAIFALMAAMMYGGFQGIVTAKGSTDRNAARLKALQMTYLHMGRDFRHLTNRSIRDEFGSTQQPLMSAQTGLYILELTRTGYPNPANYLLVSNDPRYMRSNLKRVAYGLEDNTLYKYSWNVLDRGPDSRPSKMKLLDNVEQITLEFLDNNNEWKEYWPLPALTQGAAVEFPRVVKITIDLKDWGRVERLYELPVVPT